MGARIAMAFMVLLVSTYADALTMPIAGAVAFPAAAKLYLPFPAGSHIRVLSGYSPSGGSSLHADTDACCKANDYYALDLVYDDKPNAGKGEPVSAPLAGKVVRAGWATSGWANYGLRIILEHDLGDGHTYHSLYAHLDSIDGAVTEGATVTQGQMLGRLGQSCQGALSCGSFSTPHLHWVIHRDSSVGGSGTGGSYGGNAVVPEPLDGAENLAKGQVITSTNTGQVVCGDGFCSGNETNASCPQDCPVCVNVPPMGRTIGDTDLCAEKAGDPQYWYAGNGGHDGSYVWTHAVDAAMPDNYVTWKATFDEAGDYDVDVFVEPGSAGSKQAKYVVTHAGTTSEKTVDQSVSGGWTSLGTFAFVQGGAQSVRLNDNTGEAFSLKRALVFDAVRFTRIGGNPMGSSSSSSGSGGSGSGGAGGSGGTSGGGGHSGGASGEGGGGNAPGSTENSGSCNCRFGGQQDNGMPALAALIMTTMLGAMARRKTRV